MVLWYTPILIRLGLDGKLKMLSLCIKDNAKEKLVYNKAILKAHRLHGQI